MTGLSEQQKKNGKNYKIVVEGHTDSQPIFSGPFPSNWELSSSRATRVVRLFLDQGYLPQNLLAIGYADTQPVAESKKTDGSWDEENLAKNRRVVLRVLLPEVDSIPWKADPKPSAPAPSNAAAVPSIPANTNAVNAPVNMPAIPASAASIQVNAANNSVGGVVAAPTVSVNESAVKSLPPTSQPQPAVSAAASGAAAVTASVNASGTASVTVSGTDPAAATRAPAETPPVTNLPGAATNDVKPVGNQGIH